jgi:hypothetical protein
MTRIFRNKAEKEFHIKKWEQSSLSKQEYCKENKIPSQTFYNWLRKKGNNQESSVQSDFVKLTPVVSPSQAQSQIILPNGIEIRTSAAEVAGIVKNLINII